MRKLSLGPDTQPLSKKAKNPKSARPHAGTLHVPHTVTHLSPEPHLLHTLTHTHPSGLPITHTCTHRQTASHGLICSLHMGLHPRLSHITPPWLCDRTLSRTSKTHWAVLRHVGQAQPLHPGVIKAEQTPSKSEKQMHGSTCLEPSASPVVSLRPVLRQLWLRFVPSLIMKQALSAPSSGPGLSQPGVRGWPGRVRPGAQATEREKPSPFKVIQAERDKGTSEGKKPPEFLPCTERSHLP